MSVAFSFISQWSMSQPRMKGNGVVETPTHSPVSVVTRSIHGRTKGLGSSRVLERVGRKSDERARRALPESTRRQPTFPYSTLASSLLREIPPEGSKKIRDKPFAMVVKKKNKYFRHYSEHPLENVKTLNEFSSRGIVQTLGKFDWKIYLRLTQTMIARLWETRNF